MVLSYDAIVQSFPSLFVKRLLHNRVIITLEFIRRESVLKCVENLQCTAQSAIDARTGEFIGN